MPSANWSFPCSPRNPAKVREELRLLGMLVPAWRLRGLSWSPRSGAQLEFGRQLRLTADGRDPPPEGRSAWAESAREAAPPDHSDPGLWTSDLPEADPRADGHEDLRFRTQAAALTDDNLRWTARARFGTYKFFGLAAVDASGFAALTPAGERFVQSPRPGEVLLRQLLKWQYPDNQHRGRRWPAADFAIFPFIATARLIRELEGLTREEIALFCFTMRRTEDAAATAEAIRQFRARRGRRAGRAGGWRGAAGHWRAPPVEPGRVGAARRAQQTLEAVRARHAAEGRRVVVGSMNDYADALVRYFRYTGLFSVRGARIVVAAGREVELDELIYPGDAIRHPPHHGGGTGTIQLALGEAPPVRLAAPQSLFTDYADATAFYAYYGDAERPRLPWEDPRRLADLARTLDAQVAALHEREARLRSGRRVLTGPALGPALPAEYESLVALVDRLRWRKFKLESALYALQSRTPQRLAEALDYYGAILAREVIDPPTFLEWNTWRVFLALDHAREIVPHLALDDDLQPLTTAQGNQPDLEVDFGDFVVVAEVTLRTGTSQRQAEARPVTRHIIETQRRYDQRPVFGLFVAPAIHEDTATDFFVALKYRVIERRQVAAIPLTLRQLVAALRPFAGHVAFEPRHLRRLLDAAVAAGLAADTGDDWLKAIDAALRRWLAALGAPATAVETGSRPMPLPLFK